MKPASLLHLSTAASLLLSPVPAPAAESFAVPQAGKSFNFPRDHGSHPEFRIEWWYVTGHLFSREQKRYGFQATFFRRATLALPSGTPPETFSNSQVYLAHMALLDASTGTFLHQERLNRAGWDAVSSPETLDIRNGNWTLQLSPGAKTAGTMTLSGSIRGEAAFSLTLTPAKPLVIFGENGVSRKGSSASAASHYLTWPRLSVAGALRTGTDTREVTGSAWMDHEISSSQLAADQAGWDWASLQLDDGREIMAYRMRKKDGTMDPFSTLAWIDAAGRARHVAPPAFRWETGKTWTSPASRAAYPIRPRITAPDPVTGKDVTYTLEPLAENQELDGGLPGLTYWEGACRVLNADGRDCGRAFLELAGYAGDLSAHLK